MDQLKVGIIGGSGMAEAFASGETQRHEMDTPFGKPSDAIIESELTGVPVFFLSRHGPGHTLNPSQVPYRANIFALKQLGCTHIIASGAVGSLREEMKPRDLVIANQIIDKTSKRVGTFYERAAVHVEFAEPFCAVLRRILLEAGVTKDEAGGGKHEDGGLKMEDGKDKASSVSSPSSILHPPSSSSSALSSSSAPPSSAHTVHDRGCYVAMEGPAFSTRAESLMHRLWGGDLIGMTAMPETKLAREAEISYALVALVTDYDSWRQKPPTTPAAGENKAAEPVDPFVLLKEIIANLEAASANAVTLIRRAVELIGQRREEALAAPSRSSLKLAIWSDKAKIDRTEVERLAQLWGKYFV